MKIFTVVGYILASEPQTPKYVDTFYDGIDAAGAAIEFCKKCGDGNFKQINERYFVSNNGTSYVEARIYETSLK